MGDGGRWRGGGRVGGGRAEGGAGGGAGGRRGGRRSPWGRCVPPAAIPSSWRSTGGSCSPASPRRWPWWRVCTSSSRSSTRWSSTRHSGRLRPPEPARVRATRVTVALLCCVEVTRNGKLLAVPLWRGLRGRIVDEPLLPMRCSLPWAVVLTTTVGLKRLTTVLHGVTWFV